MADKDADPKPAAPPAAQPEDAKKSGRVSFDSRGNSVWEWQMKTGVFGRDIDPERLKTLEERARLSIAEDTPAADDSAAEDQKPKKMFPGKAPPRGGGFNPYDHGVAKTPPVPKPIYDPLNQPLSPQSTAKPSKSDHKFDPKPDKKPGLFKRLFGKS